MTMLILGCLIFFGVHSVHIVRPDARRRAVARWGEAKWQLAYSLLALVGLLLIIMGYGQARQEVGLLYAAPTWGRHVAMLLMLPVFPLLLATYLPGRIQQSLKHPMLIATLLWAVAHLFANGGWADVVLFGSFLVWAAADLQSYRYRDVRPIRRLPAARWNDGLAVAGGLVLYVLIAMKLHRWITGVPVM